MSETQIAILWGLALVVVVVFVVLIQVLVRTPQRPSAAALPAQVYSLPDIAQTAHKLYPLADQAARSWQSDAQLVSAVANWPFVRLDALSQPAAWTFQFFSASTHKLYVVNVDGTQVSQVREGLSPYPLPVLSSTSWHLDSYQALNTWLNQGGGEMLGAHPVVDLSARLRVAEDGRSQWIVVGVARETQDVRVVRIDASSGQVLD